MNKILQLLAKYFLGTGITTHMPWLKNAYLNLYTKLFSGEKLFDLENGMKITMPLDSGPGIFLLFKGEYEPYQTLLFNENIKEGDIVFDVGAHVGYYSLISSKAVGNKGKVIACEPSSKNVKLLRKNVADNDLKNIYIIDKAVSSQTGSIKLYKSLSSSGENSIVRKESYEVARVASTTIDNLSKKLNLTPALLKIDVEGAELEVLSGATTTLKSKKLNSIFVEVSNLDTLPKVISILEDNGYNLFILNEQRMKLESFVIEKVRKYLSKMGYTTIYAQRN